MHNASIGIDLGKTAFHLVALDDHGTIMMKKKFSRKQLLAYTPSSLVGIEACSGDPSDPRQNVRNRPCKKAYLPFCQTLSGRYCFGFFSPLQQVSSKKQFCAAISRRNWRVSALRQHLPFSARPSFLGSERESGELANWREFEVSNPSV
jgi:hypothetical protein